MIPFGTGNAETVDEPEPEGDVDAIQLEPIAEPPTSRFAMHDKSLGAKYPSVLSDPMVRPEGILVWSHKQCELRARRDYKVQQAYQAYEIGLSRVRRGIRIHPDSPNQSFEDEGEEDMYDRYAHSNLSDVSQPDLWMEIHHQDESNEERYMRYLFAERDEVSDGEYWDELFEQAMRENEETARRTPEETLRELERDEDEM